MSYNTAASIGPSVTLSKLSPKKPHIFYDKFFNRWSVLRLAACSSSGILKALEFTERLNKERK